MYGSPDLADFVNELAQTGALTPSEAADVERLWPAVGREAWCHPTLRAIREHTRAAIEREARRPRDPVTDLGQRRA